jgi:hypothetical protein
MEAYQKRLTESEQTVRRGMEQVLAAETLGEVDAARLRLADVMAAEVEEFGRILPPKPARYVNQDVIYVLRTYDGMRLYDQATKQADPGPCTIAPSLAEQLGEARKQIYWRVRGREPGEIADRFANRGLRWGGQLLPPEPADLPVRNRRAPNGDVIERNGNRGPGRLRIVNETEHDTMVAAVRGDPKRPNGSIYVRSGSTATLAGLSGTYSVYLKAGSDWDARHQGFTRGCTYEKFVRSFSSRSYWTIELGTSKKGNAPVAKVPAF